MQLHTVLNPVASSVTEEHSTALQERGEGVKTNNGSNIEADINEAWKPAGKKGRARDAALPGRCQSLKRKVLSTQSRKIQRERRTVTRAQRGGLHLPRLALQPPLRLEPLEQRLRRRLVEPAVLDGRAHQGLAHVLGHLLGGTRDVDMPLVVAEHLNGQRR